MQRKYRMVLLLRSRHGVLSTELQHVCRRGKEPVITRAVVVADAGGVEERRSLRAAQLARHQGHVRPDHLLGGCSGKADTMQSGVFQLRGGGRRELCLRHRPVRGLHYRMVHKDMVKQPQQAGRDQHHQGHRSIHTCSHIGTDCLSDLCADPGTHTGADCLADAGSDRCTDASADCLADAGSDRCADASTHYEPDSLANYSRGLP